MGYTPQEALGGVVAGVLFLAISLTPIEAWIINSIPKSLKLGIGAGIGLFLLCGGEIMGVVAAGGLVTLGDIKNPLVILGCLCFVYNDSSGKNENWEI